MFVGVLGALVLELRHALHLAHIGDGVERPAQLRVLRDHRLHIERALFGIQPAGDVERRELQRMAAKKGGILLHRDGVHIGDRKIAGVVVLHIDQLRMDPT